MVANGKSSGNAPQAETGSSQNPLLAAIERITAGAATPDTREVQLGIITRTLEAKTVDEIFETQTLPGAEDVEGIPTNIQSVTFGKSRFEDGMPMYAVVTAVKVADGVPILVRNEDGSRGPDKARTALDIATAIGETLTYSMGGGTALAQLVRAHDSLPLAYALVLKTKESGTAAGFYPLFYVKA